MPCAPLRYLGLVFLALAATPAGAQSKAEATPTFWQRDPAAAFADEGRMHCAPTAAADGLIYLANAFELEDLVPGAGHEEQIELIKELADDFETDPAIGGTNPDKILTGLRAYVESKGYQLSRLELKSWRGVSAANRKCLLGLRPDLPWMQSAAEDEETVVLFNFGWYEENDAGGYTRNGGHWVAVVGRGEEPTEFLVHNPLLRPECRRRKNPSSSP